jgi:hypothetical protein
MDEMVEDIIVFVKVLCVKRWEAEHIERQGQGVGACSAVSDTDDLKAVGSGGVGRDIGAVYCVVVVVAHEESPSLG